MTIEIQEGNLSFLFEFDAIKLDDSQYYRNHFIKIKNGIKAVDILAVNSHVGHLIEIKDYTNPDTKKLKLNDLIESLVNKIISSLALILPMKNNASNQKEREIAKLFSKANQIKFFFHIELPPRSKLEQSTWKLSTIQMQLKKRLKPIDAHPKVVSKENLKNLPWKVENS